MAALAIRRDALLAHPALAPVIGDRLGSIDGASARLHHAPDLAARLRSDVRAALDLAAGQGTADMDIIGQALLASVASGLSLAVPRGGAIASPPQLWVHYGTWRSPRMESHLSKRQAEKAVAAVAGLGPKSLLRLERLHRARRALQVAPKDALIGDVAATFGFSDWSRFSASYRRLFGERPVDTRNKGVAARN
ncbi:MAG: helix-turn-helix domain-containing protein [Tabrizicola sp.]